MERIPTLHLSHPQLFLLMESDLLEFYSPGSCSMGLVFNRTSRNLQVGPHKGRLSLGERLNNQVGGWKLEPIRWSKLSVDQQSRAVRLCALLNAAFAEHGWISLMIQGFQEGLDVLPEVAGYPLVTLEDLCMPGITKVMG